MYWERKTIVLGITGSIACFKALELIKDLKKRGAEVHCIMTGSAMRMLDPKDVMKASQNPVKIDLFDKGIDYRQYLKKNKPIRHIALADIADLIVICPATANVIGKLAHGLADDLLTTTVLATQAPVLLCPAMNVKMWKNPLVQENVRKLAALRYEFIDPEYGELACGYTGVGRLADPKRIVGRIGSILSRSSRLKGKKILVTAGATQEAIDPVRYITNKSSGKMGIAIAEEALLQGAEVTLIRGVTSVMPRYHLNEIQIRSVDDLLGSMKREVPKHDIVIHAAAVSDFAMAKKTNGKIKSGMPLHLELEPTTKILERIKEMNPKVILIGFKAEYNVSEKVLVERAFQLLKDANAEFIVANDVAQEGHGFDTDTNEVVVVAKNKKYTRIPLADKQVVGSRILEMLPLQAQ